MENENKERKKIRDFIKVNEPVKKILNFIKVNKPVGIVVTVLACLAVVGVSFTVYSKYYKTGFNKGMATASGFYFNSNYMASVEELRNMTPEKMHDIIKEEDILNSIIVSMNRNVWDGINPHSFDVEIRNYDNQLLYNDKDLNVTYEVNFMLLGEPVNAAYSVEFDGDTQDLEWEDGKSTIATYSGTLDGGTLNYDNYKLMITPTGDYQPTDVLMVAYPIDPVFLRGTKAIAGIVRANYQEKKFSIEGSRFLVTDKEEYQTPSESKAWKNEILSESAYVYQLYTSGNFSGTGAATKKTITVKWREDMYIINDFDTYYQEAKEAGRVKYGVEENGHKWTVMEIDILPYASLKFTFFRADEFEKVINGLDETLDTETGIAKGKAEFESSVQIWYEADEEDENNTQNPDTGDDTP